MIKYLLLIFIFFPINISFANGFCSASSNGCSLEHLRELQSIENFKEAINNYFKLKANNYSFNNKNINEINYNDLFTYNIIV